MTEDEIRTQYVRLLPQKPEGTSMVFYFKRHFGYFDVGQGSMYSGYEFSVNLSLDIGSGLHLYASGSSVAKQGSIPSFDEALNNAVLDLHRQQKHVSDRELSEYRKWRSARERAGMDTPAVHDDGDAWEKAVKTEVEEAD